MSIWCPVSGRRSQSKSRGTVARLFVHDNEQPTLIVNDVKSGAQGKGAVALWLDAGTVAHFRNLRVAPAK